MDENKTVNVEETANVNKADLAEFVAEVICKTTFNVIVGLKKLDVAPDAIAEAFAKKLVGKVEEVKKNTEKIFG